MKKIINVLIDNESWILPYGQRIIDEFSKAGYKTNFARSASEVREGWICFMLGCVKIMPESILLKNQYNLVVHESDLPKGRGFAPMTWQILEGASSIPVMLIDAVMDVDQGPIWLADTIELNGSELCPEWRSLQGEKTVELCLKFVSEHTNLTPVEQSGVPSQFPKRKPSDSELNIECSLRESFNLLRVVDNDRYPAHFYMNGCRYNLAITKCDE